jgi:hypothetical protein
VQTRTNWSMEKKATLLGFLNISSSMCADRDYSNWSIDEIATNLDFLIFLPLCVRTGTNWSKEKIATLLGFLNISSSMCADRD